MGHQAGIPTLNQGQPAGLLTGEGDLGWGTGKADRKPLRKQEYGSHQWPPLKKWQGNVPWYLEMLCGGGGLRNLRCQRCVWGFVHERTVNEQAGTTTGLRRNKKRPLTPCENDYALKLFPKVGNATKFSGKSAKKSFLLGGR